MRLRLHGTESECRAVIGRICDVLDVVSVSEAYPDRGASLLVRVYVEVRVGERKDPDGPPGGSASGERRGLERGSAHKRAAGRKP